MCADRQVDALALCAGQRLVVTGIDMADDAHTRIRGEHALDRRRGFGAAVSHRDLAGVQAVAHAHAATMVKADPRST